MQRCTTTSLKMDLAPSSKPDTPSILMKSTSSTPNRGRNIRQVMQEIQIYIRGWLGYFYIASMKRTLTSWNQWLRRRIRMYIWKQWKKPRTRIAALRKLGIPDLQAYEWGNTRLGYWRIAASPILNCSITDEKLAQAGYFNLPAQCERLLKLHVCD